MNTTAFFKFLRLLASLSLILLSINCDGGGGGEGSSTNPILTVKVSGLVFDSNGTLVPSATVTITSDPIVVTTNNSGYFSIDVPPGNHTIAISKSGITFYEGTFTATEGTPLSLGSLAPTTPYYVNGNPNGSEEDTQAPTVPQGVQAIASSNQINLNWNASTDNMGVIGYKVYRGGIFLKQVSGTTTSDTGLTPSTQYCYTVSSGDAAGNWSAQSIQRCATTLPVEDNTPPNVISISPANNALNVATNTCVIATFSENINPVSIMDSSFSVTVDTTGNTVAGTLSHTGSTVTFTPSTFLNWGTRYTVTITSGIKDMTGNSLSSPYICSFSTTSSINAHYMITILGTLGGDVPSDINNNSQVVGLANSSNGDMYAFLYSNGSMTDLGTLGGDFSNALGINNSGQVVGVSRLIDNNENLFHAFLYSNGTMTDLGTLGGSCSMAYGINNYDQVVGYAETSNGYTHAFLYGNGTMSDLGTLGGFYSIANGINDSGNVVGESSINSSGYIHAFLYSNGTMSNLGTLPGDSSSTALSINGSNQIVGISYIDTSVSYTHAFLYSNGTMNNLGTLGGLHSYAFDINNSGQVVGVSIASDDHFHAFLFSNGVMTDLNSLIPPGSGWYIADASAINDLGQIVGTGSQNGVTYAVLLTPF